MKRTGRCPKCGSEEVVEIPGGMVGKNWLPVGMTTAAIDRWVCCGCGYSEEWVDPEKLEKIQAFWK